MNLLEDVEQFHGYPVVAQLDDLPESGSMIVTTDLQVWDVFAHCSIPLKYSSEYPTLLVYTGEAECLAVYGLSYIGYSGRDTAYLLWANNERFKDNLVLDWPEECCDAS